MVQTEAIHAHIDGTPRSNPWFSATIGTAIVIQAHLFTETGIIPKHRLDTTTGIAVIREVIHATTAEKGIQIDVKIFNMTKALMVESPELRPEHRIRIEIGALTVMNSVILLVSANTRVILSTAVITMVIDPHAGAGVNETKVSQVEERMMIMDPFILPIQTMMSQMMTMMCLMTKEVTICSLSLMSQLQTSSG